MPDHPLDRVVWEALTTRQRHLAEGGGPARRYSPAVAPFAATADAGAESFRALHGLLGPGGRAALFTAEPVAEPAHLAIVHRDLVDQMILKGTLPGRADPGLVPLAQADVPAMLALVEATRPGPFGPRTIEMGTYLGVRDGDALAAMTGERMRIDGFTEVSAVCVAPSHRGQGLAAALLAAVAGAVQARGETPFLHVFASNAPAIALYRKLGFVRRRQFHLALVTREG